MKLFRLTLYIVSALSFSPVYAQKPEKAKSEKTQCIATTKKGTRCKLEVVDDSKFCPVHYAQDPNAQRCKAITQKGARCKRPANSNGYCTQHSKKK